MASVVHGCASGGGARSTSQGGKEAPKESPVFDPKNPPRVILSGLQEGDVLESSPVKLSYKVAQLPLSEEGAALVLQLNDGIQHRFHENEGSVELKDALRVGPNLLRAYLLQPWGEAVKVRESVVAVNFFYQKKKGEVLAPAQQPLLTLVSPQGSYVGGEAAKIPFDFILSNAELGERKYRVHYTLNGEKREVSSQKLYYFQNLEPGAYNLKLQVVDSAGRPVKGLFTSAFAIFSVEKE